VIGRKLTLVTNILVKLAEIEMVGFAVNNDMRGPTVLHSYTQYERRDF